MFLVVLRLNVQHFPTVVRSASVHHGRVQRHAPQVLGVPSGRGRLGRPPAQRLPRDPPTAQAPEGDQKETRPQGARHVQEAQQGGHRKILEGVFDQVRPFYFHFSETDLFELL